MVSDQVRATSTRADVWKAPSYLAASGHRKSSFCTDNPLWLSYKVSIRVTFEINNWYETNKPIWRQVYFYVYSTWHRSSDQGLKRPFEKQTLNSLWNVAAEPCQTPAPENYSTGSSSPKFREILIHFCLCHLNMYLQHVLAYIKTDWYYT